MHYFRWSYSIATAKYNSRNYMIIPICVFKIIYDINVCMCVDLVSNEKIMKTFQTKATTRDIYFRHGKIFEYSINLGGPRKSSILVRVKYLNEIYLF